MISERLIPAFEYGELVAVLDDTGAEQLRGPLLGSELPTPNLRFGIGFGTKIRRPVASLPEI